MLIQVTLTVFFTVQSGVTAPIVHSHVFAEFLKTLVEVRCDLSWIVHRNQLEDGETYKMKLRFLPAPGTPASIGLEKISAVKLDRLVKRMASQLFGSPPLNVQGLLDLFRSILQGIPVRASKWSFQIILFPGSVVAIP